jgi:hypothetical protein
MRKHGEGQTAEVGGLSIAAPSTAQPDIRREDGHYYVYFYGTREALIAAGIAKPEWLPTDAVAYVRKDGVPVRKRSIRTVSNGRKIWACSYGRQGSDPQRVEQLRRAYATYDPTEGMTTSEKVLAGIGAGLTSFSDNMTRYTPAWFSSGTPEQKAERVELNLPLLKTQAGAAGYTVGVNTPLLLGRMADALRGRGISEISGGGTANSLGALYRRMTGY